MMNCKQATQLISEGQERPLTFKERMALKIHLMMCAGCENFNTQMGTLRQLTRRFVKGKK